VIVDAKDAAVRGFCERYGFQRLVEHQNRPFLPMLTIEAVVRMSQPGL
jgi:hypothetical protein